MFGQSYKEFDAAEAGKLVSEFIKLDDKTKSKIRVALDRLNLALRRSYLGDTAIDICIALESIVGGNETNEVTHKVTTRTVKLLGGNMASRMTNRDIVKAAYNYRSGMVHNGQEPKGEKSVNGVKTSADNILAKAIVICADVIKIILRDGKIPEWQNFDIALEE